MDGKQEKTQQGTWGGATTLFLPVLTSPVPGNLKGLYKKLVHATCLKVCQKENFTILGNNNHAYSLIWGGGGVRTFL